MPVKNNYAPIAAFITLLSTIDRNIFERKYFGRRNSFKWFAFKYHSKEYYIIIERTKTALSELKKKGVVLGNPENLTDDARLKGALVRSENAKNNSNNIKASAMAKLLKDKKMNLRQIALQLNMLGYETRRNCMFRAETVKRLINRQ